MPTVTQPIKTQQDVFSDINRGAPRFTLDNIDFGRPGGGGTGFSNQIPTILLDQFAQMASGTSGFPGRSQAAALGAANLGLRRLGAGARRRVSRRLGPRSGAAETASLNQLGPLLQVLASQRQTDERSERFGGIEGLLQLLALENAKAQGNKGGISIGGLLGGIASIAAPFVGPGVAVAGGATSAVSQASTASPRNLV